MRLPKELKYLGIIVLSASALFVALGVFLNWKDEANWAAYRERSRITLATPIDTAQFHISAQDRQTYPVDVSGNFLDINFASAGFLNPGGDKILPAGAWVRSGPMDVEAYTSPGQKSSCGKAVVDDVRHNYPDASKFHSFEQAMPPVVTASQNSYEFFVSTDKTWVARCWDKRTCITFFSNQKWTARLDIAWQDLCKVPSMYARLSPIVDRWVK